MLRKLLGRLVRLVLSSCLLRNLWRAMPALKQPELALVLVHYQFGFLFVLCFPAGWPCFLFRLCVTERMAGRSRRLSDALKNCSRSLLRLSLSRSCFRHLAASLLVKICLLLCAHAIPAREHCQCFGKAKLTSTLSLAPRL